jgi:hypothetical protein
MENPTITKDSVQLAESPIIETPKPKSRFPIFLIVGILLLLGSSIFFIKYFFGVKAPLVITIPENQTNTLSSWKTFTDNRYGFTFKMPDYYIDGSSKSWTTTAGIDYLSIGATEGKPGIWIEASQFTSVETWKTNSAFGRSHQFIVADTTNDKLRFTALAQGQTGFVDDDRFSGFSSTNGDKVITIGISHNKASQNEIDQVLDQMSTTFKFTNSISKQNWKVINNTQYGFSFSIPVDLQVSGDDQGLSAYIMTKANNQINLVIIPDTSPTISEYLVKADKISQTAYEGQQSLQVNTTTKTVINGLNVIQREEYLIAADLTQRNTYFKNSNIVVSMALQPTPGNILNQDLELYNQILSTFKFTSN